MSSRGGSVASAMTAVFALLLAIHTNSAVALAFAPQFRLSNFLNDAASLFKTDIGDKGTFAYTHLEGNGQLWQASNGKNRVSLVIDPLASQLDFGIPWGYRANKKVLSEQATIDLICDARPLYCLLTMGLDDHTHLPTLNKLRRRIPDLRYIVAPSCEKKLRDAGFEKTTITVLNHGRSCTLFHPDGSTAGTVTATEGASVGPPWRSRENGYLFRLFATSDARDARAALSVYYEPHADVVLDRIAGVRADVMVSPVVRQSLPARAPEGGRFTLVHGGERTIEIAEAIGAKTIVPLGNGALDVEGPLATLVEASGDVEEFESLLNKRNEGKEDGIRVVKPVPGVPLLVEC